jgi:hypothetical protein
MNRPAPVQAVPSSIRSDVSDAPGSPSRPRRNPLGAIRFVLDLVIPTALFYVLIHVGASLYVALLVSALASAFSAVVSFLRGQRQGSAIYMLLMASLGFALALVTGSDRFLLARDSVLTATAGCWFLASLRWEQPLTYRYTRALFEGRGRWVGGWDELWKSDPRFRHIWRVTTWMWGIVTLIDAALRVVMAYTLPVKSVPALQTGLMIATMLLMQVITNGYYTYAGLWRRIRIYPHARGTASRKE